MMDLRVNSDLDILISNKLWDKKFKEKSKDFSLDFGKYEKKLEFIQLIKDLTSLGYKV